MHKYDPAKIEKKWQKYWEKNKVFQVKEDIARPKFYILDMFPYPSGVGLHVGHPKGYIATDVVARMKMMQGFNVLHPMGWDAFGLPAENYALKNKMHPVVATAENVKNFKRQIGMFGLTYDWEREINTTDPEYYRWTQWIFIQLFKKGLAFESHEPVNWCPGCKTVLANEDLEEGRCERCGSVVEQKPLRQWVLRITDYADRLLLDLDLLPEWPEAIKEMQRNWIGRSEGALVKFGIQNSEEVLEVFTTRPDTLFGATYCVVAPEHTLLEKFKTQISNWEKVMEYIEVAKHKTTMERTELQKEKTGVELIGVKAVNPVNGEALPIFVADYVLTGYGTGAIMAVPAHDERDWEFAKKYNLAIKQVVERPLYVANKSAEIKGVGELNQQIKEKDVWSDVSGRMVNSSFLNNLEVPVAKVQIIRYIEEKRIGERKVQYKLRDWVFSRQRYWGEPIPLVKCGHCGWVTVPEKDLPLELPKVESYEPTGTGGSPLANIENWVNTKCPTCGGPARRETNTMPQWAGSCWYYLRYCDPHNDKVLIDKEKEKYWNPVDFYVGGAEHATRHLIYARFWHKFLYDIGVVNNPEPFTKLRNVGLILAEDGRKMSKRWNNVVNPDDVVGEFGADAMRLYEMFMGPFEQSCAWSTKGVVGVRRFLDKVWVLQEKLSVDAPINKNLETTLHKTIKKVGEDIAEMRYNTAIAKMMELANEMTKQEKIRPEDFASFVKILAPFAPHFAEELWEVLGNNNSVTLTGWPQYDPTKIIDETITLAIQINGKLRDTLDVPADISEEDAKAAVFAAEKIQKWLEGKEPKKIIYVKGKLLSIVV